MTMRYLLLILCLLLVSSARVEATPRLSSSTFVPSKETVRVGATDWPAHLQGSLVYIYHETTPASSAVPFAPSVLEWNWTVTLHARLDFRAIVGGGVAAYDIAEGTWDVTGTGSGEVSWDMGGETCSWAANGVAAGSGSFSSDVASGTALLRPSQEATFAFSLEGGRRQYDWQITCSVGGGTGSEDLGGLWGSFSSVTDLSLHGRWAGDGAALDVSLDGAAEWAYDSYPFTRFRTTWTGGLGPRVLRLVVEPEGYDTWRPEGAYTVVTNAPAAGNTLAVRARLVYDDGGPAEIDAERFTFTLFSVSREPGVALNHPIFPAEQEEDDLRFEGARNPGHTVSAGGVELTSGAGGKEATAVLSAFDWGAWGDLVVTADMGGGWTLAGRLEGEADTEFIPIPKRERGSRVATAWKRNRGVAGQPDDADADARPAGDGPGDGLTLYEEYRGFYENGRHLSTDPTRKDLFVFDEVGGITKQALAVFAGATDLAVHHEFRRDEYLPDRVVNLHAGQGPRRGDQHGLRLVATGGGADLDPRAVGPGRTRVVGTPGSIHAVEIPRLASFVGRMARKGDPLAQGIVALIARELGHAVNVHDHSERADFRAITWQVRRDAAGHYLRDAVGDLLVEEVDYGGIFVRDESGTPIVPRRLQERGTLYLPVMGVPGGPHSGDDQCFMRDRTSAAYRSDAETLVRYYGFSEPVGMGMCARRNGTGVNSPDHYPQSRYGPAEHGACTAQIRVNDQPSH